MELLSKLTRFSQANSNQPDSNQSLNSKPISSSQLSVREQAAIKEGLSSESYLIHQNDSTSMNSNGEIVPWSPSLQSLLDEPPSNLPQRLIFGGIIFCLAFVVWAWFGQIEEVGKAQGELVPKGEAYKIESVELAKVSQIAVEEGEEVKAGQLIAELDPELATREVERLKQMLESYQIELNQKRSLLEKVEVEAKTHQLIAKAEVQTQQSAIDSIKEKAQVIRQLLAQQKIEMAAYNTRQNRLKALSAVAEERFKQLNSEIEAHRQRLKRLKPLEEAGAVSQEFIFQAEQSQRQTQQQLIENKLQEISNVNEQIFQSQQSLREMEARITQSQGDLSSALKEVERLQAELEQKQAERRRIELEAQQKMQQLGLEISQTNTKIAETKNLLVSAQSKLDQRFLTAPVDGTVLSFNVQNIGKVVKSGETIAEIAPHGSPLVLSAVLPVREAGFIENGMPAQVKLDAYSYQDYGLIPGKVISVSADTKTDEKLGAVYRVEIELERDYITDNQKQIPFKPGQTASADIVIHSRRVLDVLLDPIKRLQQDGIDL